VIEAPLFWFSRNADLAVDDDGRLFLWKTTLIQWPEDRDFNGHVDDGCGHWVRRGTIDNPGEIPERLEPVLAKLIDQWKSADSARGPGGRGEVDLSPGPERVSEPERPAPNLPRNVRCEVCGYKRPSVRTDPETKLELCDGCWARMPPGPDSPRR
jgi:hypothetical protein